MERIAAVGRFAATIAPNCQIKGVHMLRMSLAAIACFAILAVTASSARADASAGVAPNCEAGQGQAADAALARGDSDAFLFHLGKLESCFLGQPPGPPLMTNPPRCESGQGQAADEALTRGDFDAFLLHLGKLESCFLGEPPGAPL
jgi:hypothetical protein